MFTGIVQTMGIVDSIQQRETGLRLAVRPLIKLKRIAPGSSAAIDGVCLTVMKKKESALWFDVVSKTVRRTTLGSLKEGDKVNLEPSLRVGDEIGGHFVLGHVDGVGVIKSSSYKVHKADDTLLVVEVSRKMMRYIAEKGSVAVDGVSLTVAAVRGSSFTAVLVPYTLRHTTLGDKKKKDAVNVEVDVISRYLKTLVKE